jgi:hypothetical protein
VPSSDSPSSAFKPARTRKSSRGFLQPDLHLSVRGTRGHLLREQGLGMDEVPIRSCFDKKRAPRSEEAVNRANRDDAYLHSDGPSTF